MKQGRSIQELAREIERQAETKRDFIASTQKMSMVKPGEGPALTMVLDGVAGPLAFPPTDIFHGQVATHTGIPKVYYDRMRVEAPSLLAHNVNVWFDQKPVKRMVRTLDGNARAFLSDKYRPLDNLEVMEATLPALVEAKAVVMSCEVTERRVYLKAVVDSVMGEVRVGDPVRAGVIVSNSEVGEGSLRGEPFVERLVCKNGMVVAKAGLKKYHVGGRLTSDNEGAAWEVFSDATRQASDRALFMQLRDVVRACLNEAGFQFVLEKMREAAGDRITAAPDDVVEVVQKQFRLTDGERVSMLKHLAQGGDMTRYGLLNAMTAMSQEVEEYDRATELERAGGYILELPKHEWKQIAEVGVAA